MEVFQVGHLVGIPSERMKTETGKMYCYKPLELIDDIVEVS
jgi:hypothetical protein